MPLTKAKGNMYPWVTHTHTHLAGQCAHKCAYCYVQAVAKRFGSDRYTGPLRLVEKEFEVKYGSGKAIFVEHCNDLFADDVPPEWIRRVLAHCRGWPENEYVFQTKNPSGLLHFQGELPIRCLIGTTIETSDQKVLDSLTFAPTAETRARMARLLRSEGERVFVTIEPIMAGDMELLGKWIADIRPEFVNIGADSKGGNLPEPTGDEVRQLISIIQSHGIEIREKRNLGRLISSN